ncbi:MAG: phage holin family protein [Cyanobacteria bacterium J06621_11]
MLGFVLTTLVTALSLIVVDFFVPGVGIATFPVAMGAAISIGFVNGSIKPLIKFLSLPITLLSLGSFSLVINGFCLWFASLFVPGFTIHGLFSFLLAPIVLSMVSTLLMGYVVSKGLDKKLAAITNKFARKLNLAPVEEVSYQPASEQVILVEAVEVH